MAEMESSATIKDVAAMAGVSPATVSNFFHHPERMSPATRERIRDAVAALDFTPNEAARSLRRGRHPIVGYIAFELASARTPAILTAISDALAAADMHLLSAVDGGDPARERAYLELLERQRVSGVIISPVTDVEPELARLRGRGLASVLCAHRARNPEQPAVYIDHVAGGRMAAEHLLSLGRRRLAYVTDTLELPQIAERFAGVTQAVERVPGATIEVVWTQGRSVEQGEAAARQLLLRSPDRRPDGVLAANDLVGLGVCGGLRGHVAVPEEIAVIGYDDIEFARLAAVPLTSIRTPQEELGARAAALLLDQITGSQSTTAGLRQVELRPTLVVRESTAPGGSVDSRGG